MAFNPVKINVEAPVENNNDDSSLNQGYVGYEADYGRGDYEDPTIVEKFTPNNSDTNVPPPPKANIEQQNTFIPPPPPVKNAEVKKTAPAKFNIPELDSTPIAVVLEQLGAEKKPNNSYEIYKQEIIIKDNKWYNKTLRKGHINSISLLKHITAIKEKLVEDDNQKILFISACKQLIAIQEKIANPNKENVSKVESDNVEQPISEIKVNEEPKVEAVQEVNVDSNNNQKTEAKPFKQRIDWKALTEQLNQVPLNLVMELIGANPNEDGQRGKWKVWKTGHNIQITGQQWHSWNAQRGGVGGISLLAFQMGIENNIDDRNDENRKQLRKMAIKEMMKQFGSDYEFEATSDSIDTTNFKEPFAMPHVIDFKINQVKQYLHEKRGLPMWIINKQIKAGSLFAGYPSDWKEEPNLNNPEKLTNDKVWATFLAINGNAAEMRAIERSDNFAKLLAKGSDKDLGGFLIKAEKDVNEKTVVACEASIDTMSYHSFYPGRIVTSCMGVNFNLAVKSAVEALENGFKFQLAFDNDLAGNEAAVRFKEQLINEVGEEDYNKYIADNMLNYFDLGVRCFKKTIEKGGIFYFDVKNNDTGREAAKMFQDQIYKTMAKEDLKEVIKAGKLKYANIAPIWGMITDARKEAQEAFDLLNSPKPFYLVLKHDEDDTEEIKAKKILFEKEFKEICGNKLSDLEKEGKVIYKKQALAKDWNEFFNVMKKDPRFTARLQEQEVRYASYSEDLQVTKKSSKGP